MSGIVTNHNKVVSHLQQKKKSKTWQHNTIPLFIINWFFFILIILNNNTNVTQYMAVKEFYCSLRVLKHTFNYQTFFFPFIPSILITERLNFSFSKIFRKQNNTISVSNFIIFIKLQFQQT